MATSYPVFCLDLDAQRTRFLAEAQALGLQSPLTRSVWYAKIATLTPDQRQELQERIFVCAFRFEDEAALPPAALAHSTPPPAIGLGGLPVVAP